MCVCVCVNHERYQWHLVYRQPRMQEVDGTFFVESFRLMCTLCLSGWVTFVVWGYYVRKNYKVTGDLYFPVTEPNPVICCFDLECTSRAAGEEPRCCHGVYRCTKVSRRSRLRLHYHHCQYHHCPIHIILHDDWKLLSFQCYHRKCSLSEDARFLAWITSQRWRGNLVNLCFEDIKSLVKSPSNTFEKYIISDHRFCCKCHQIQNS